MAVYLCEYKGHAIEVTERGDFVGKEKAPEGQKPARDISSLTLESVKKSIDRRVNAKAKQKAVPISLPVFTLSGKEGVITAINLHDASLIGVDQGYSSDSVLPDTPWIRQQVKEILQLEAEIRSRIEPLRALAIKSNRKLNRGWDSGIELARYEEAIDRLKAEYTQQLLAAEEAAELATERKP